MSSSPIRVAHVITRMILGGAQENTLLTCRGLHEHPDYEVQLITGPAIGPEGELLSEAERLGIPVTLVPPLRRAIHPWRDLQAALALRRLLRDDKPDVVHTHSTKAGILGRWAARKAGVRVVVHTIHGLAFHPYERWWRNRLYVVAERRAARWTDQFISVADAMTRQAQAAGVGRDRPFETVYSGMEVERFLDANQHRDAMRRELGFGPEHVVVGKVARLFALKGYGYVLEAAARLLAAHPEVRFLFVGDGILRPRLEAQAERLGIRDRIVFAGLVPASAVPRYIAAMDALVHASLREGLARVLPQALLAGKPVVSFAVDGAPEVVIPGETGYLVPPKSVDGLVEALADIIEHPDQAAALAARGRALCRDRFPWRKMVAALDRIYRRLLGRG
ncbi:MAG: glycosyltransferase family 4 protein [Planctomycetota bacterium]